MPDRLTPPLAIMAIAVALAVHIELLARVRRVDERDPPWYLGYERDGANMATAIMLWGGYLMARFPPAVALSAAMLTTLGSYLLDWLIARALKIRHARLVLALPLSAWVTLVALMPRPISDSLGRLVALAQPIG